MRRKRVTITIREDILRKVDTIIDNKKIRNRSNAIETILLEKFKNKIIQKAVVLGAYRGVKIKGKTIPEILIPLKGKTLIEHNIEKLKEIGVNELVIATGKFEKEVSDFLGDGSGHGIKISYIESRGTAGVFKNKRAGLTNSFIMFNGDVLLSSMDLEEMYNFHIKNKDLATIAVATATEHTKFGSIFMKGNKVVKYLEKADKNTGSHIVNTGVYVMEAAVCSMSLSKKQMLENDIFPDLATSGRLGAYHVEEWVHLHEEKDLRKYLKSF